MTITRLYKCLRCGANLEAKDVTRETEGMGVFVRHTDFHNCAGPYWGICELVGFKEEGEG